MEALQAATEGEWAAVAEILTNGEATLLLPKDPPSIFTNANQISASFAYDHTLFGVSGRPVAGAVGREGVMVVTLSGLRGRLKLADSGSAEEKRVELTLQSFVTRPNPTLKDATARAEVMDSLSPLPNLPSSEKEGSKYPSFQLGASNATFPLPPSLNAKKDGEGQAVGRARSNSKFNAAGSRASASFASIFGGSGRERRRQQVQSGMVEEEMVDAQRLSPNAGAAVSQEGSDAELSSTLSVDVSTNQTSDTGTRTESEKSQRTISVWVVDHLIRRSSVMRSIRKTLDARVRTRLEGQGVEREVAQVVASFAGGFLPLIDSSSRSAVGGGGGGHGERGRVSPQMNVANPPYLADAEDLAESFQDFYLSIRDQQHRHDAKEEVEKQVLETIEAVLCEEVYDRIFNPFNSKDRFRDDALSSRIAAFNVLGLSLRHLGLDLPESGSEQQGRGEDVVQDGLEKIVSECGKELQKLERTEYRSPREKLNVLIRAHKVLVEGLATLPKIKTIDALSDDQNKVKEGAKKQGADKEGTSADLILPILIYTIVRSNPAKLASSLLYIQRFRSESLLQGEGSYCLVNVQAAVAFLEGVDVKDLGLDSGVIDAALRVDDGSRAEERSVVGGGVGKAEEVREGFVSARLRGRVAQEIGDLAAGVLGSGVGVWGRRMMGAYPPPLPFSGGGGGEGGGNLTETSATGTGTGTGRSILKTRTSSNSTPAKGTDYSTTDEQSKDLVTTPQDTNGKPSIGDRLASLSIISRLGSSPSSTSIGIGLPSSDPTSSSATPSITSPRVVSRELPGPPPPTKPAQTGRTTSYLAAQLGRITGTTSSLSSSTTTTSITPEGPVVKEVRELPASLRSPHQPLSTPPNKDRPLHVVLVSTGSVASVKVPLIVEELLKYKNVRVMVVASDNSLHFYKASAIEELNRRYQEKLREGKGLQGRVYGVKELARENLVASRRTSASDSSTSLASAHSGSASGQVGSTATHSTSPSALPRAKLWTNSDEWTCFSKIGDPILHIELRRWADIVLVAPCSANTLAKLNAGICDGLVTSFMRALPPPSSTGVPPSGGPSVVLFPAMNTLMYLHPLTAIHLKTVKEVLGYQVLGPIEKNLACGDLGIGAMVEWLEIVHLVVGRFGLVKDEEKDG